MYEVTKEHAGSVILQVPLLQPAPPYAVLRVAADHGQGYGLTSVYGTVTADGLHAVFSPEGASLFALGINEQRLADGLIELSSDHSETIFSAALEAL
ncbi:MAG TPA: hypothetical protein VFI11_00270, partial [Anaerolineales bacterium]|nr:hypothetical protein [Anaerolineales bacterium]